MAKKVRSQHISYMEMLLRQSVSNAMARPLSLDRWREGGRIVGVASEICPKCAFNSEHWLMERKKEKKRLYMVNASSVSFTRFHSLFCFPKHHFLLQHCVPKKALHLAYLCPLYSCFQPSHKNAQCTSI